MEDVEQEQGVSQESWSRWQNFILAELKSLRSSFDSMHLVVVDLRLEVAKLDERARASSRFSGALWGMISGVAVVVIAEVFTKGK